MYHIKKHGRFVKVTPRATEPSCMAFVIIGTLVAMSLMVATEGLVWKEVLIGAINFLVVFASNHLNSRFGILLNMALGCANFILAGYAFLTPLFECTFTPEKEECFDHEIFQIVRNGMLSSATSIAFFITLSAHFVRDNTKYIVRNLGSQRTAILQETIV